MLIREINTRVKAGGLPYAVPEPQPSKGGTESAEDDAPKIHDASDSDDEEEKHVVTTSKGKTDKVGYCGATVLESISGIYDDCIACCDFASLYPSIMMAHNLSYETHIDRTAPGGWLGQSVQPDPRGFDGWELADPTSRLKPDRFDYQTMRNGQRFVSRKHHVGLLTAIVENLVKARKAVRAQMKRETSDVVLVALEQRQIAIKYSANSVYGACGAKKGKLPCATFIAETVTNEGRAMIDTIKYVAEKIFVCNEKRICHKEDAPMEEGPWDEMKVVYGDSVTGSTPLIIRHGGLIKVATIESLAETYGDARLWMPCADEGKQAKEACTLIGVESWTDSGWTPMHRVIRHTLVPSKRIIRVTTHNGIVDVTDDHSLVRADGSEVSPRNARIGDALMHAPYPSPAGSECPYSVEEARVLGFFMGSGVFDMVTMSVAFINTDIDILEAYQSRCQTVYPTVLWSRNRTMLVPKTHPGTGADPLALRRVVDHIRASIYANGSAKRVPDAILNASEAIRAAFWTGTRDAPIVLTYQFHMTKATLRMLAVSLDHISPVPHTKQHMIVSMESISYKGYVYDVTTDNHHFQAGVGQLIVHNTDSIFILQKGVSRTASRDGTVAIAQYCTSLFPTPVALEFEKLSDRSIFKDTKKRYAINLYDDHFDDDEAGKVKVRGMSLVRRDNFRFRQRLETDLINIILNRKHSLEAVRDMAAAHARAALQRLSSGDVPLYDLLVNVSLTKPMEAYEKSNTPPSPKLVAARRLIAGDPNARLQAGDRFDILMCLATGTDPTHAKKSEFAYDVKTALRMNLPIHWGFYVEACEQCVCSLLGLFFKEAERRELATQRTLDGARVSRESLAAADPFHRKALGFSKRRLDEASGYDIAKKLVFANLKVAKKQRSTLFGPAPPPPVRETREELEAEIHSYHANLGSTWDGRLDDPIDVFSTSDENLYKRFVALQKLQSLAARKNER